MLCCWLGPRASATEVGTQRGHSPQLELGPAIPCFYPLWPNRFGLFLNSCWSEPHKHSPGVVTKHWLCLLPGAGAAALSTSGRSLLHAQHRNLLCYTILSLLGEFLGSFGCLGSQGWKCCSLWHWGDVGMNRGKRVWKCGSECPF